jgi:hypothetical protein
MALIPFSDQSEIRREAGKQAVARQGEATAYRFDLEMEEGSTAKKTMVSVISNKA